MLFEGLSNPQQPKNIIFWFHLLTKQLILILTICVKQQPSTLNIATAFDFFNICSIGERQMKFFSRKLFLRHSNFDLNSKHISYLIFD
jgi:hypothetical protein